MSWSVLNTSEHYTAESKSFKWRQQLMFSIPCLKGSGKPFETPPRGTRHRRPISVAAQHWSTIQKQSNGPPEQVKVRPTQNLSKRLVKATVFRSRDYGLLNPMSHQTFLNLFGSSPTLVQNVQRRSKEVFECFHRYLLIGLILLASHIASKCETLQNLREGVANASLQGQSCANRPFDHVWSFAFVSPRPIHTHPLKQTRTWPAVASCGQGRSSKSKEIQMER